MPTNENNPTDLTAGLVVLRREFDAVSAASRSFGQEARRSLSGLETETRSTARGARDLGRVFTGALGDIASSGKSLKSVLQSVAVDLAKLAAENLLGNSTQTKGPLSNLMSVNAKGNAFDMGRVRPFAKGGVLSSPTFFPMRGGTGLAGEAGPEAIMPLRRGADGRLGVAGGGAGNVSVTFNVTARDAESFKKSEGQIAALLQRSLNRGARNL
ncbi:MAG: phage tail tape measure protein [Parvibaculum sp.]